MWKKSNVRRQKTAQEMRQPQKAERQKHLTTHIAGGILVVVSVQMRRRGRRRRRVG